MKYIRIHYFLFFFIFLSSLSNADQNNLLLDNLFIKLQSINNTNEYKKTLEKIWEIWLDPSDPDIEKDFNVALSLMHNFQYKESIILFSKVIIMNPNFAEAWNKRATVYYLIGDYNNSINDINQTLILEPRHFGALNGLGIILVKLKKYDEALIIYRKILKLLPYDQEIKEKIKSIEIIKFENI
tara:strand:- start:735 stop:1286 length:552 start_codon:yes stop_codon:yes gene_type:complete